MQKIESVVDKGFVSYVSAPRAVDNLWPTVEYKVLRRFLYMDEKELNELGLQGWKLAAIHEGAPGEPMYHFSRVVE